MQLIYYAIIINVLQILYSIYILVNIKIHSAELQISHISIGISHNNVSIIKTSPRWSRD